MGTLGVTAFMLGLLGGAHCFGMCGGLIGAVSLARPEGGLPVQLGYNIGRVASYSIAGAAAGVAGSFGQYAATMLPAQMMLLVIANATVILLGLSLAGQGSFTRTLEAAGAQAWKWVRRFQSPALPNRGSRFGLLQALSLGAVWGWVPCGLVYSALALALVSGSAGNGAMVMIAFGSGTLPSLLAAGLAARRIRSLFGRPRVRQAAGTVVALLGLFGLARIPGLADSITEGLLCIV